MPKPIQQSITTNPRLTPSYTSLNSACHIHIRLMTSQTDSANQTQTERLKLYSQLTKPKPKSNSESLLAFPYLTHTHTHARGVNRKANTIRIWYWLSARPGSYSLTHTDTRSIYSLAASCAYYNWRCSYRTSLSLSFNFLFKLVWNNTAKMRKNMSD